MSFIIVRGGGELSSGVALRLRQSGLPVIITELPMPLAVRRRASFASAVYTGHILVNDCLACRVDEPIDDPIVGQMVSHGTIPVLVDPAGVSIDIYRPKIVIDGRMLKQKLTRRYPVELLIGLGPGFVAGENCDVVVETNRGNSMGSVIWQGTAAADTAIPETIEGHAEARVLRAPADGLVETQAKIGDLVVTGQTIARVGNTFVSAPFNGVLRGLIHRGVTVRSGMRIGDLDPRNDPSLCARVSDRSLAVAEGVLEAIRSKFDMAELRK
ncbi:MAG: EF2563 family selenium-dependent molybdenum hydroxylase system protein [Acidobacteria bacterium]|nr:EF2563 family selenium-dependent molybdenum hydroxylase system protein [Acidobacteriota bacterium]